MEEILTTGRFRRSLNTAFARRKTAVFKNILYVSYKSSGVVFRHGLKKVRKRIKT